MTAQMAEAAKSDCLRPLSTIVLLLMLLLFSHSLLADSTRELVGDRPNSGGDATLVAVRLYVIDIDSVDDVKKRFDIDMFINISWLDPRLALAEDLRAGRNRTIPLDEIWSPRGLIVNDRGLSRQLPLVADVDDLGGVQYRQRFTGELAFDMDLREFPFDTQVLPIEIISYQYSPDDVRFSTPSAISLDDRGFSADSWQYEMLQPEIGEFTISAAAVVRPQLTFAIEAKRKAYYYVVTMMLPIALILFMSWMAFWLQPDIIPARVGISTASIFSLIAFGFSIRLRLPPVSYMTKTDIFVAGSMLMVFLALAVAVVGSRWANSERMEQALRLNAIARWAYVGLFFLVVVATAVH
jgi:hypothetical protein